ncbi:MAG: lamin tail domain-containing protein [Reichenbachiella sp.]|uniref:lamin tail domain-containing protein n=1 Tax=Reichenbachiella sp. TaxID=2184521 RepID=UPI0032640E50
MRYFITLLGLFFLQFSQAQVNDNFADGDFTSNPVWSGETADFDASGFDLHLDAAAAGESYLATAQTELGETTWEFLADFDFNLTVSNHAFFYLVSDQADLSGSLNGYYVSLGSTNDDISLYRQTGTTKTKIVDGTNDVLAGDPVQVRIRVTRDASANWSVYHDTSGGSTFSLEGSATDNNHSASAYTGVRCVYTSTRKDKIGFDDISVTTAAAGFAITSVEKEGDESIRITFNQNVDATTAETVSNYTLNYGFDNPNSASRDVSNLDEVLLVFGDDFVNNSYTLNIDQVQNEALDETIDDIDQTLDVEIQTPFRNIVINEIMADPSPQVGLPNAEFIELYNATDQAINIGDFMIDARTLDDYTLEAHDYVTLTTTANAGDFTGNVIGLSGLSLSNAGEDLELTDNLGNLVDSVSYTSTWYQDSDKDDGGYTLEQINPELACSYESNWIASNNTDGGTPGTENSVYDNSLDQTGPNLIDFIATDANTFLLTFDEPMDETSLNTSTYIFDNGVSENGVSPVSPGFLQVAVDVTPDLTSGTTYTLSVSGATDCAGNAILINSLSFDYDTNPPSLDRIVVRNESQIVLFFNEELNETLAEDESNYTSDHSASNPESAELNETDASQITLSFEDEFELDVEHTLTITSLQDIQGNALSSDLTSNFTFSQDVDTVRVLGINLLDVYFNQKLDQSSAETVTNYLVDDEVGHPVSASLDNSNSKLVHLAFSNNFDDNQDLTLSISDLENKSLDYISTPDMIFVYDTSPPKLDTVIVISSSELEVVFLEKVDEQSAESKENYEYEDIFPIQATLATDELTVTLDFGQDFNQETVFELSIDEVKDLYGNGIKTKLKQEFVYDIFEPQLDSIIVRSANELILWFNENLDQTTAQSTDNYTIGSGVGQPSTATIDLEYPHIVYLDLPSVLPESKAIEMSLSNLSDQRGNTLATTINTTFDYDVFYISRIQVVNRNTLSIEFNKTPDPNTKEVLSNYSTNGKEASEITFATTRIASVSFEDNFLDNSSDTLSVSGVADTKFSDLHVNIYPFKVISHISSASLLGDRSVALEFDQALDFDQTLNLADFDSSPSLGECIAAIIDEDDNNILRLTFEEPLVADQPYQISWANLENIYGNDIINFFITVVDDQTPPSITEYLAVGTNAMWLKFSEALNEVSAEFLTNYQITPDFGYPIDATYEEEDSTVLLEFSSEFMESITYTLSTDNIEDLSDNALFGYSAEFSYEAQETPDFGELIISEIMADPTPEVGLPDVEYLEIYNTSSNTISLSGVSIVDEGGSTTIVSGEIEAGNYLILTSTSGINSFTISNVITVSSFPSLNNSGETLSLFVGEKQIFTTSYRTAWYKNSEKEDGGWSLEMIDLNNPCGELNNWTASVDESGGTPGFSNSTAVSNPDNFGPQVIGALAIDEDSLVIIMDEKIHPEQFTNASVSISPHVAIASVALASPENMNLEIDLQENLETGELYEIAVSNITDCKSNTIQTDRNTATFRLPELAAVEDIIVNEVLFNPNVGGVDFVEIYNNSEKAINLKNWTLSAEKNNPKSITTENFVLNPAEYLVLTPDPEILAIEYPKGEPTAYLSMSSFPTLSDTEDSVILRDEFNSIIDQMYYEDDYHFNLLDDDDGVSLERVSFDTESFNSDSWKSAASTEGFATPGLQNSQYRTLNESRATISIDPKVFVPDNTGSNDYTTISYQLDQTGNFANVNIYSTSGDLVKTLAEGELLSINGFFTWDGINNQGGRASVGYYVVFFEIFDGQGNKSIQKETVVLGARF